MATTPVYGFTLPVVAGDSGIWGGENNTLHNDWDGEIARPRVPFLTPTYNVGGTTTLDCSQTTGARVFLLTVSGASTLAFSGVPSSSFDCRISLIITNGSAFVLTFPASVTWLSGIAPTFKASGVDIVDLETKDAGTTWYAMLRNLKPGVIYEANSLTTTSGTDASLGSYVLPAGVLGVNAQAVRITLAGLAPAGGATVNLKFGATAIGGSAFALAANEIFWLTVTVTRTGATAQIVNGFTSRGNTPVNVPTRTTAAETLANAITIDFRGNATTGGQTLTYDVAKVELLARA